MRERWSGRSGVKMFMRNVVDAKKNIAVSIVVCLRQCATILAVECCGPSEAHKPSCVVGEMGNVLFKAFCGSWTCRTVPNEDSG